MLLRAWGIPWSFLEAIRGSPALLVCYFRTVNGSELSHDEPAGARERLLELRSSLLSLHKALVDSEGAEYEKTMGKIQSSNHFLKLLTSDPWFAWLSPLSLLIVSIDEALDGEEPLTAPMVEGLVRESQKLLVASEDGSPFAQHYFHALQRDPDVILAQGDVSKLRGWRKG